MENGQKRYERKLGSLVENLLKEARGENDEGLHFASDFLGEIMVRKAHVY